jgi:hypothetical protein
LAKKSISMSPDSEAIVVLMLGILFCLIIIITLFSTSQSMFLTVEREINGDAAVILVARFDALDEKI